MHTPNNDDGYEEVHENNLGRQKVYNFTQHESSSRMNEFLQKEWTKIVSELQHPRKKEFLPQNWIKLFLKLKQIQKSRLKNLLSKQWGHIKEKVIETKTETNEPKYKSISEEKSGICKFQ